MSTSARQRVDLIAHKPEPTLSRPLPTGRRFLLVLAGRRLVSATWDKAGYLPGEQARLAVSGKQLGSDPLELVVETEQAPGVFAEVTRIEATVAAGGASAAAAFAFPAPPVLQVTGQLLSARFSRAPFAPGDGLELSVQAVGLAGAHATLAVERELPGGGWEAVAELPLTLGEHGGEAPFRAPAPAPAAPAPESCAFASLDAQAAWLQARAPALEGKALQFVLEREEAPGHFVEVGQAVATVRAGEARAPVPLGARGG